VQKPIIEKHRGKWLKEIGDGILASFQTISDAVYCAIEIQRKCEEETDLKLRIGIHLGEVILEEWDVFGDGVNIASRLESMAPSGGIYVSESVYRNIENKKGIRAEFVKEETLKYVKHPVRIYEIDVEASEIVIPDAPAVVSESKVTRSIGWINPVIIIPLIVIVVIVAYLVFNSLGRRNNTAEISEPEIAEKSIAVLPFVNMSNDPDQDYFSDGMMDEILMHLFKIGGLEVKSRTSVMQYKGTIKTSPQIAQELGVAHVLEGSVRKSEDRIKITVQLIDAQNDLHLWAESYDRNLKDVFEIQSEVAREIANALKAEITPEVNVQIEAVPTKNIEAYDLYLEALFNFRLYTDEGRVKSLELLEQAVKIDPDFANAYVVIGIVKSAGATWISGFGGTNPREAARIAKSYYLKAIELDDKNFMAHERLACNYLWFEWDFEKANIEYIASKKIRKNHSWSDFLIASGRFEEALHGSFTTETIDILSSDFFPIANKILSFYFANQPEEALNTIEAIINADVKDPYVFMESARVYLYLEKYDEVIHILKLWLKEYPENKSPRTLGIQAIANFHLGKKEITNNILEELIERSKINAGGSPSFYTAMIYAQMGETDLAFDHLEKAYDNHEVEMYWLKVEPPFEPLREDPRWQIILDKVGFPE
jgi:TolB-like protein